jgi:Zn-dependent protease
VLFSNPTLEELIGLVVALVIGITFHEFSHAFVANELGDHRVRALGRVSLNPLRHLDPLGSIFILLAGFGWGRPVPVNVYALRPGRIGMTFVALAGPIANMSVAAVVAVVFRAAEMAGLLSGGSFDFLGSVLFWTVLYNVVLALFNLLPIPPLDGYNVVLPLLPPRYSFAVQRYAQYGILVLLLLVVLSQYGGFSPLSWLFDAAFWLTRLLIGA